MPNIIVGTAGHIDHGKTSLVKALTGIDADRLKEEKERGITIDLGFASLQLDEEATLGFVDVPGHERFVKNMLAGAGGIDAVMLVVAADESVMPQTREHLDICSLLHVRHGVTVLTKIDAAEPELVDLVEVEVQDFLRGSFLDGAPVLRVSSRTGEGIPRLVEELGRLARQAPPRDVTQIFRLPIDRCFTMKGFGTVVSGTLISGRVRRDDEVELLPARQGARVRGIQVHGGGVDEARAGQRTALNLQRVELGDVQRGMIVAPPAVLEPTRIFDVHLELLSSAPAPIVRRKRVRFHVGTSELMGYAVLLGQDVLEPGREAFAQILLEAPTVALPGDRFIIRQYSPMRTLGGGEILDPRPRRHRRSDMTIPERLERFQDAPLDERLMVLIDESGVRGVGSAELVARLGAPEDQVQSIVRSLAAAGSVRILSEHPLVAVATDVFSQATAKLLAEVKRFHASDPLLTGIGREELKAGALPTGSALLFRNALDQLVADRKLALEQDVVHLFNRTVTLRGEEERIRTLLTERFRAHGLQVPSTDDVLAALGVDRQTGRRIVQLMVKESVLVKISEETTVDREALQKLIADVKGMKSGKGRFGVSEFKDLTGLTRKFALPLLEYLDSQRITRRMGDERVIL